MITLHKNKLNMYKSLLHFLQQHPQVWAGNKRITNAAAALQAGIGRLEEILRIQSLDMRILTRAKDALGLKAYREVDVVASAVRSWARELGDFKLMESLEISVTRVLKQTRGEVVNTLRAVLERAAAQAPNMPEDAPSAEAIRSARAVVEAYEAELVQLQALRAARTTAGAGAEAIIREIALGLDTMDDLMPHLPAADAEFVAGYRRHRSVEQLRGKQPRTKGAARAKTPMTSASPAGDGKENPAPSKRTRPNQEVPADPRSEAAPPASAADPQPQSAPAPAAAEAAPEPAEAERMQVADAAAPEGGTRQAPGVPDKLKQDAA